MARMLRNLDFRGSSNNPIALNPLNALNVLNALNPLNVLNALNPPNVLNVLNVFFRPLCAYCVL
jgi:hypothetical protein